MREAWIAGTLLAVVLTGVLAQPTPADPQGKSRVAVHLTKGTNDLHAVTMALKIARGLQSKGADVLFVLDLEGVRVVDVRQPADLSWGHGEPISRYYDAFVKAGGKMLVCPHCAAAVGLDSKSLRTGAEIAKSEDDLAAALLSAESVIDY